MQKKNIEFSKSKRSIRYYAMIKIKSKLKKRYTAYNKGTKFFSTSNSEEYANFHWQNTKKCSCWICGNKRKYFGLTKQEKINKQKFKEQLTEYLV